MGVCIAVVSGKGGTGKTSFVSGVGSALAMQGYKVLCIDCDTGLRNLDLSLGLSDKALMDFTDVAQERCTLDQAVVQHDMIKNLYLLTAPMHRYRKPVQKVEMYNLLYDVRKQFDYCLLDSPAGLGVGFTLATCFADRAIVVTNTDLSSLRDAQHTVMDLEKFPRGTLHLVVNRVRKKMLRRMHTTIDDAIDTSGLPLIGIVPEDDAIPLALNQNTPLLLCDHGTAAHAYQNIALRMTGHRVPLLRLR